MGLRGSGEAGGCSGGGRLEPVRGQMKVGNRQVERRWVTAWVARETVKVGAVAATMSEEEAAVTAMAMAEEEAVCEEEGKGDEMFFFV